MAANVDRAHPFISNNQYLDSRLRREDLIERQVRSVKNKAERKDLLLLLIYDIKGGINSESIKRSSLTRVDINGP
jgi:hypothetical protein